MKGKIKKRLLLLTGIISFVLCALWITDRLTTVCITYTSKADKIEKTLYRDDPEMDEVEVCLIGGSHGINAFNPNILWESAGLHSYNYCYAGETIALSKVYLEELYKKHDFELVVLEPYYAGIDDKYFGEKDYAYDVLNKMHFSFGKMDYINDHVSEEVRKNYWFPLRYYHSRWCDLTDEDKERKPDISDDWKLGQDHHFEVNDGNEVSFLPWADDGTDCELAAGIEKDLCEFIELAKSHGSKVLLADLPRRMNDSLFPAKWLKNEYAVLNRVKKIAARYDVDVLSYDDAGLAKIGFDPAIHMYNKGHMNLLGSEVYSRALGRYITSHMDVSVHKRDASDIWEGYLSQYKLKTADAECRQKGSVG